MTSSTILTKHTTKPKKSKEDLEEDLEKQHAFYTLKVDAKYEFKGLHIKKAAIVDKLLSLNFYRHDIDDSNVYVRAINNKLEVINKEKITDAFMEYVKTIEPKIHEVNDKYGDPVTEYIVTKKTIREALYEKISEYFSLAIMNRLTPPAKLVIKKHGRNNMFFCYQNCIVDIYKDEIKILDYTSLNGEYVWNSQVLSRDFKPDDTIGVFEKYFNRICGHKEDINAPLNETTLKNKESLMSITGYLLHNYSEYKLKAVILTDERMSDSGEPNGRTGKTLYGKGLSHMLNAEKKSRTAIEINGKNFDQTNKHRYESSTIETQLINVNDLKEKIPIEIFFNDITEGVDVDQKNKTPFKIFPKILVSTNKTLKIFGGSNVDRAITFCLADWYKAGFGPLDEFDLWFFTQFTPVEWNRYDSFMFKCVQLFLQKGVIEIEQEFLNARLIQDHTSPEFDEFMTEILSHETINFAEVDSAMFENEMPVYETRLNRKHLYKLFLKSFTDYNETTFKQRRFTDYLLFYSEYSKLIKPLSKKAGNIGRSGGQDFVIFSRK